MSFSVGVVIPTHNRSELLEITLRNVFCSSGVDLSVVVIDDVSTDNTPAVLAAWTAREPRLKVQRFDASIGACRARNLGFASLDTEFVCFLDADDLVHPEKFVRQATSLRGAASLDGTVCQMAHFETNPNEATLLWNSFKSKLPRTRRQYRLPRNRFLAHDPVWGMHAPLWRSSSIRTWGGFDETLPMAQDFEFHARVLALGAKVSLVPELLCYCRQHAGPSIGKSKQIARTQTLFRVFQKLKSLATHAGDSNRMSTNFLWLATLAAHQGERKLLWDCLGQRSLLAAPWRPEFRLYCYLAAFTGKYRFFQMARDLLVRHEIDVTSRESWYMKHLIADEVGLVVLPMPDESF